MKTHLIQVGASLNFRRRSKVWCTPSWPCKRIASCSYCVRIRRNFFIRQGVHYILENDLNRFVTISWTLQTNEEVWTKLLQCFGKLSIGRRLNPRKYVRVLAIGGRETPHTHIILNQNDVRTVCDIARKTAPKDTRINIKAINDQRGILGYLFDKNFLVALRRTDRPKRIRILSGSRGMSYGFPKTKKQITCSTIKKQSGKRFKNQDWRQNV